MIFLFENQGNFARFLNKFGVYCKITIFFSQIHLEKKYTKKEYLKIVIIVAIIVIPLIVAYGAAGYFEENGTKFWSEWNCEQMTEFEKNSEFSKITNEQKLQYNLDLAPCFEDQ